MAKIRRWLHVRFQELGHRLVRIPFRHSHLRFPDLALVESPPRTPGCSGWPAACGCVGHDCAHGGSGAALPAWPDARSAPRPTFLRRPPTAPASESSRSRDCAGRRETRARSWWRVSARAAGWPRRLPCGSWGALRAGLHATGEAVSASAPSASSTERTSAQPKPCAQTVSRKTACDLRNRPVSLLTSRNSTLPPEITIRSAKPA